MSATGKPAKVTVRDLQRLADEGRRIVSVTAYDAVMGRLADEVGVDLILVGDSLGMTMLGYDTTVPVTLQDCLRHTAAVVRGVRRALVVADMPFLTYQITPEQALRNAARFLQSAGADAVKLEGGERLAATVQRLVECGIPVLGHIGILPQCVKTAGGYHVQGRTAESAARLLRDAEALQEAGAFAVVLEGIPMAVSAAITAAVRIPTIGIGAGPQCDGQVQVLHDILGLFEEFVPRHTRRYAELGRIVRESLSAYCDDVRGGRFPGEEQSFR
ncbi:MAG: 3-methyl-2-oxobutanoate hydroxymethyltransferase [Lentisphaeria bacterium]|nr:3-methyl-2-oxobutanoate hydroxymethyltransferase [Lentisphaeria bacterium]